MTKDDDLTPEQLTRVLEAVGRLEAKRQAYRQGWTQDQVGAAEWIVNVELLQEDDQ